MLERTRPAVVRHGAPYLTFTHGGLPPQGPKAVGGGAG
jgi:hypothetical protein